MVIVRMLSIVLACAAFCRDGHAQIIGKIPPATPPTPAYEPPPPPEPAPPPKPPEPEKPLPVLGIKEADGKLRRYPQGAERAAIELFEFDADSRKKIAASEAARGADVEKMVIEKLDKALSAREALGKLDKITDFAEFARLKDVAQPVMVEKLTDRLMRDGAITPIQRSRIDQMVKDYESALKTEWEGQTGTDVLKIVSLVGREKFVDGTRDAMQALDRLLTRAAKPATLASAEADLNMSPQQKADVYKAAAAGQNELIGSLELEQLRVLLRTAQASSASP